MRALYQKLSASGLQPWMDTYNLLPGEQWELAIRNALRQAEFVVVCLSRHAAYKRGFLQKEIKTALDLLREKLDSDIYVIPVRLEKCQVPDSLQTLQWVDLFEADGWPRLLHAIKTGVERRQEPPPEGVISTGVELLTPTTPPDPAPLLETQKRFAFLCEVLSACAAASSLQNAIESFLDLVIRQGGLAAAERGAVLLGANLVLMAQLPADARPSTTLARQCLSQNAAFIWTTSKPAPLPPPESVLNQNVKAAMYAPLLWGGKALGVACVDNQSVSKAFTAEDLRVFIALAHCLAAKAAERRSQDLADGASASA